jgi:hypothetical protein
MSEFILMSLDALRQTGKLRLPVQDSTTLIAHCTHPSAAAVPTATATTNASMTWIVSRPMASVSRAT